MAKTRTYISSNPDPSKRTVYKYFCDWDFIIVSKYGGSLRYVEGMSAGVVRNLTAQGVPPVLWKGSPRVNYEKPFLSLGD